MEVARQLQLMRQQLLDEAASRWADVAGPLQVETAENRQRVDALEQWLREALAPELVRLQLDLASEHRCRERLESVVNKQLALSKTLERARAVSISPRLSQAPQAAQEQPRKTISVAVAPAASVTAPHAQAASEGLVTSMAEIVSVEPLPAGGSFASTAAAPRMCHFLPRPQIREHRLTASTAWFHLKTLPSRRTHVQLAPPHRWRCQIVRDNENRCRPCHRPRRAMLHLLSHIGRRGLFSVACGKV